MEEIRLGLEFQSALPRRERHNCDTIKNRALLISIRAPAKGATISFVLPMPNHPYFNPRSREGSDSLIPVTTFESSNFNPRSREGSDLFASLLFFCCLNYFNPRSREGSDSNIIQQFSFFCIILYILSVIT
jgi:hypothetical protein